LIHFFTGDDTFSKQKEARRLAQRAAASFQAIDVRSKNERAVFHELITAAPLFAQSRVFYVANVEQLPKAEKKVLLEKASVVQQDPQLQVVFDVSRAPTKMQANKRDFALPKPWKTSEWISRLGSMARERGLKCTPEQLAEIFANTGSDPGRMDNELAKFQAVADPSGNIPQSSFQPLLFRFVEEDVGESVLAILRGERHKSVPDLFGILEKRTLPVILYAFAQQLLLLYRLKLAFAGTRRWDYDRLQEAAKQFGCPIPRVASLVGYRFQKSDPEVPNLLFQFSVASLQRLLQRSWEGEYAFKMGEKSSRTVLADLVQGVLQEQEVKGEFSL